MTLRVSIERGGGLAGLVETTVADTADLAETDAATLRAHIEAAGFFDLAGDAPAGRPAGGTAPGGAGGADRFSYAVTVEDGDRSHTVRRPGNELPDGLAALITLVRSLPAAAVRLDPPG
ncbi:MAG TPA: protealysin inhibitor emfourin [Acidimicrobiia bacterium]|nr:protealysin inhibitor emfourin [Acidimicrobiia bacterium]